ncbi:MAG: M20/M25/M40 family metallo-hydrolase [Phycisphaerales bacterium]
MLITRAALALALVASSVFGQPDDADPSRPEAKVTKERLIAEIAALPVKRAANGDAAHRQGLRDTEELLLARLRELGYTPTTHDFDFLGSSRARREQAAGGAAEPTTWRNIIVEIPGRERPDEVLIFSAHFDAVPRSPGADDDGSGVAAILEMARLLKDRPMQRTLRLCLFNLEEVGLVGSRAYVQSIEHEIKGEPITPDPPPEPGAEPAEIKRRPPTKKILGMASLDGIGYFTDQPNSQRSPIPESALFKPPTVGDFIGIAGILKHRTWSQALEKAMKAASPPVKIVNLDFLPIAVPDILRSDHAWFLREGVPAVIVTDTANFRNPHYHEPTDNVDTLDQDRYTEVVRALVGAAHRLAGPVGEPLVELSPQRATRRSGEPEQPGTPAAVPSAE